jgi:hypothetical protein
MEEDIKILEEILSEPRYYFNENLRFDAIQIKCKAIENLLKRYKELEEENKELKKFADIILMRNKPKVAEVIKDSIFFEYIPISVIQNKIDELKDDGCCRANEFYKGQCVTICKNYSGCIALQELLEERNNK